MGKREQNKIGKIRVGAVGLFFCMVLTGLFYSRFVPKISGFDFESELARKTEGKSRALVKAAEFQHNTRQHSRLGCGSCHKFPSENWKRVRKQREAFPDITDYPKHESCLSCHRREFYGSPKPSICTICHTNFSTRNNARHPFPNPREVFDLTAKGRRAISDFAIYFPHAAHIEIVSQNPVPDGEIIKTSFASNRKRSGEESCAVCHKTYQPQGESADEYATKPPANLGDAFWLKKGTFKTSPIGHAQCFTCHSREMEILPAPQNCAACHKLAPREPKTDYDAKFAATVGNLDKITWSLWRKRDSSATFRHEFSSHAELECANCHNAASMNTLDAATKKVPVASCNLCHITATSDDGGILNFEIDERKKNASYQCVKCHITFGKMPIPESHIKAVQAAGQ